jgi:hypothetical protein
MPGSTTGQELFKIKQCVCIEPAEMLAGGTKFWSAKMMTAVLAD